MCERSNSPAASRTARCSARSLEYRTGMSQPAKSVNEAPSPLWTSCSGVFIVSAFEIGDGRAGAHQVAVPVGAFDAAHRREVLALRAGTARVHREHPVVGQVPVARELLGGVRRTPQRAALDLPRAGGDLRDLPADRDHGLAEAIQLGEVL